MNKVFIGYDARMPLAFAIANASMSAHASIPLCYEALNLPQLVGLGLYKRPTIRKDGNYFDVISKAPMSTQFAISRFLVPYLSGFNGWALFCDSDFLWRDDVGKLFEKTDQKYAVMCVKHDYSGWQGVKMDGQKQTEYPRKNWSSMMLFNCNHSSNRWLTPENINRNTGRFLHAFGWLKDHEIGGVNERWNWLEGHSSMDIDAGAVHFTRGTPDMVGYEDIPYADEYRAYRDVLNLCE